MRKLLNILIICIWIFPNSFGQRVNIHLKDSTEKNAFQNQLSASISFTGSTSSPKVRSLAKTISSVECQETSQTSEESLHHYSQGEVISQDAVLVEKKKVISKSFPVDSKNFLNINNQHGEVKVELWNKNEIKVDITITGYGNTDAQAQSLIDNVEIIERKEGDKIAFKTVIDTDNRSAGSWSWTNSISNTFNWNSSLNSGTVKKTSEKRGVEINYMVMMPKNNSLSVSNKYGKTLIPQFSAPLKITSNYGSFVSDRLTGGGKDIFVQYGSGNIKQMDDGDLHIAYSKLNIEKADNLKLTNNYGSMILDDINHLDGTIQYSSGKIGKINQTGKLSISYSDGVQLAELSKTLKTLDILSNYTAVKLPVTGDCNADFEVTTTYANFKYPENKCTLTVNPDDKEDEDRRINFPTTKVYKGKIGKGSATKITIKTNYAGVKFTEK